MTDTQLENQRVQDFFHRCDWEGVDRPDEAAVRAAMAESQ
jgi:hypothetical protein